MKDRIENIKSEINNFEIRDKESLEQYRLKFLSRKGEISMLFEDFKNVSPEQKRELGKPVNELKKFAETKFDEFQEQLKSQKTETKLEGDASLPSDSEPLGARHPLLIVIKRMTDIFTKLGFSVADGPEIESDWYNFEALNFAENHPARDMQDTFFVDKGLALRSHTSSVQVRVMETHKPPIRYIMPGRVYRNEAVSARSNSFFHQIEGIYIDENVSFADLKQTLYFFVKEFLGEDVGVRFRASYFPFTEPSAEMDVSCYICKGSGCNICKHSGWVEILGCGMIDPNVLKNCGIDPEKYSGYAFGIGIERITMQRYDVKDIRTFFENDVKFLRQFTKIL